MKKISLNIFAALVLAFAFQTTMAQFNIKIPKINKPKVEQPKTDSNSSAPSDTNTGDNRPAQTKGDYLAKPEPTDEAKFLLETLEVSAKNETRYWKVPAQDNNPSWYPRVKFDLFYKFGGKTTRFTAEYFNPDGSPWFSEGLVKYGDRSLASPNVDDQTEKKGVITTGTYAVKITDTKTGIVHFQGKFKVAKLPLKPNETPKHLFYVENDWLLPIGYVGFNENYTDYDVHTRPTAFFWFKGVRESNQFEGELYYNNVKIMTTDKGGKINKYAERGEDCYLARETCAYGLYGFEWENFVLDNADFARKNNPNGYFTKDKPGEYTVKIYYKGEPVRELKFTVDQKGWIARNAFSEQIFLNDYRVVVPVKVVGNMEKWNPTAWKTDAFYSNPLKGFVAQ